MEQTLVVFDEHWLSSARAQSSFTPASWAQDVLEHLATTGSMYLGTLRQWFADFPLSSKKQKRPLKKRLESFDDDTHRGAVNELAWWAFLQRLGLQAYPVPATSEPRPDFHVQAPVPFFVEVSTVNPSMGERAKVDTGEGVRLDHAETCRRFVGKATDEKQRQMVYASGQHQPCVLALFDYTVWSAHETLIVYFMADILLGKKQGFQRLPHTLSALVYVRRHVINGRRGSRSNGTKNDAPLVNGQAVGKNEGHFPRLS